VRCLFRVGCHSAASSGCVVPRSFTPTPIAFTLRSEQSLHPGVPPLLVRFLTVSCHSWWQVEHFHQTVWSAPYVTCCGVRVPFRVGCHSAASSGCVVPKSFTPTTIVRPEQTPHPVPPFLVRFLTVSRHSWWQVEHFHQTIWPAPYVTCCGVRRWFLVGCHSAASRGCVVPRSFPPTIIALRLEQSPHPVPPFLVRFLTVSCHSWWQVEHFHQTVWLTPCVTFCGVRGWFRVGCHSAASGGCVSVMEGLLPRVCRNGG